MAQLSTAEIVCFFLHTSCVFESQNFNLLKQHELARPCRLSSQEFCIMNNLCCGKTCVSKADLAIPSTNHFQYYKLGRKGLVIFGRLYIVVPSSPKNTSPLLYMKKWGVVKNGNFAEPVLRKISGTCVDTKLRGIKPTCITSFSCHSQILSCSCGENWEIKSGSDLGTRLR